MQVDEFKKYLLEKKQNKKVANVQISLSLVPAIKPPAQKTAIQTKRQPAGISSGNKEELQKFTQQLILKSYSTSTIKTYTTEFEGVQILANSGDKEASEFLTKKNIRPGQFISYAFYSNEAWAVGLVIAFIISLIISKRRKWFWVNSLIVLLVVFTLKRFNFLGWTYLKEIFLGPGHLFNSTALYLLTNGLVLLLLGIFVFSFRPFNDFIDKNRLAITNH